MKKIILCLLIFLSVNLFSQKKVYQQDSLFLNSFNKQNQSFALSNQKNGDLFIITTQRKTTKGVLLDSLYNIKSNFEAEPLPNKFKIFTGYTIRQN